MSASGNRGPPTGGPSIEDSLREAETRSLDFPATERAIYIRAMVARTEEFKAAGKPLDYIKAQLPELAGDRVTPHTQARRRFNAATATDL